MYLMYYTDEEGKRRYCLKKTDSEGKPTISAHPARFSPEDKYSPQRITMKSRFQLLPIQHGPPQY